MHERTRFRLQDLLLELRARLNLQYFFVTHSIQLILIAGLAVPRLLRGTDADTRPLLEPAVQRAWALRYFALAAFLGLAMYFSGGLIGRT